MMLKVLTKAELSEISLNNQSMIKNDLRERERFVKRFFQIHSYI
jgi:hypothetical protein